MFLLYKLHELMKYILGGNNIYQAANRQNYFGMACFDGEEFGKKSKYSRCTQLETRAPF